MRTLKTLLICPGLMIPLLFAQDPKKSETADVAAGRDVFEAHCSDCHNADSREAKEGPGLKGVKDGKLPSGRAATRSQILEVIDGGGALMPPLKNLLTAKEKEDVIAYVMTL
jgi:cytochrome c